METIPAIEIKPNAYYTTVEAARLLKTTRQNVESLLKKGQLHGVKVGRAWRLLGASLLALGSPDDSSPTVITALSATTFNRIWDNSEDSEGCPPPTWPNSIAS